ncbi:Fusarielin synthase fsl1 [Hypoxylon texense]
MAMLPKQQSALVGLADGSLGLSHEAPVPDLEDDMIIVQNVACSINPVDTNLLGDLVTPGAIAGMDFAGYVVAIGAQAKTPTKIEIGDRVCGMVQGMHSLAPAIGAFSQFVGADGIATLKVPD